MTSTAAPRVAFFIDGFNLYHSIKSAEQHLAGYPLKWLDIPSLCDSTLQLIGNGAQRTAIHYFTAFAEYLRHKDPGKYSRHQLYVRALTAHKVKLHTSRFQKRQAWADDLNPSAAFPRNFSITRAISRARAFSRTFAFFFSSSEPPASASPSSSSSSRFFAFAFRTAKDASLASSVQLFRKAHFASALRIPHFPNSSLDAHQVPRLLRQQRHIDPPLMRKEQSGPLKD